MREPIELKECMALVDKLVQVSGKEDLAECARLLAMNVAHYEIKYGPLPLEEHVAMAYSNELSDEQHTLMIRGMETMAGVLGNVIQGLDDKIGH